MPAVIGKGAAFCMEMAIATEADIIGAKKGENLFTVIGFCDGRIVEKDDFFPVAGSGQGCLKTKDLAIQKFFIMRRAGFLLIKPAACAADGIVPIGDEVIVEKRKRRKVIG